MTATATMDDLALLNAAAPAAAPIAARASLEEYVHATFPGRYDVAPHHRLIIEHLEAVERGEITRLMIFAPPQRGKSELVSVRFPAWCHGRNPDWPIMAFSHTASLAVGFSRQVREQIADESWPFHDVQLKAGQSTVGEWGIEGRRGRHFAAGVGGGGTGKGAMLAVIDDPFKNDEEARSPVIRDRVYRWYWKVVRTRMAAGGRIVLMHTRWHDDDLAGRLVRDAEEGGEQWVVLSLPEVALDDDEDALGRSPGEYLWPQRFPPRETDAIRQYQPGTWWPLYQQRPGAEVGSMFKREWFSGRYDPTALPEFVMVVQVVDSAFKKAVANDPSVIATWAATRTHLYVLDLWLDRVEYPDLIAAIRDQYAKWHGAGLSPWIYIEDKASGQSAIQSLRRESSLPVRAYQVGTASKESRAQDVTPYCGSGRVLLPAGAAWTAAWIEEHVAFPSNVGAHDDQVDTTTMAIKLLTRAVRMPVSDEPKDADRPARLWA